MRSTWVFWWSILTLVCSVACNKEEPPVKTPMDVAVYATLPGLTATHNAELQAELARLIAEEATPLQLISSSTKHRVVAAGDATSVISRLDTIFPPNFRESGREHLDKVWPAEGFDFSPATLHVVAALSKRYLGKREQYETLVSEVNFALPVDHSLGLAADAGYVDAIEIGHRLEGLYAAGVLAAGKPDAAIEPLRVMLRVSELLAGENSIVSRSAGAMRRGEALQVLEGIVKHPAATPTLHRQLKMLLDQQLERWPDDATAWIGDRAQGMHTYELIRGGYLLSLLSYDEIREYRDEIGIDKLAALVAENIDQDELFYLRSMRDIVEACSKPHYERAEVFRQIEANLELMRGSSNYPFVADQLLLMQMSQGSRLMALDRARCDAWALALHLACDDEPGNKTTNPLTGDEFFVDIGETQIIVDAIDPDKGQPAAVVPRRVSVGNAPHVGSPIRRGTAARTNR